MLKQFKKPIIASIASLRVDDYAEIAGYISKSGADLVELDLFLPGPDGRHPISDCENRGRLHYTDYEVREKILREVRRNVSLPIGLKSTCFLDPINTLNFCKFANEMKIDFVTAIGPRELALSIDIKTEQAVLAGDGIGRVSGASIKPLALATVKLLHDNFRGYIIGAGGINTGSDAFEYLLAGASAVQVGTAFATEGAAVFSRIATELSKIMDAKGYKSIEQVVGKLKAPKYA